MPWFKKDDPEVPAELKDKDGNVLTPEAVIAKIRDNDALKADATAKEAEHSTALETAQAKIRELEANQKPPERKIDERKVPTSVLLDEDAAFAERLGPTQNFMLVQGAMTAKMVARDGLSKRDRFMWDKWSGEIDTLMEREPLPRRALPGTWLAALTYIKGQHIDDLTKPDFFVEAGAGESGGLPAPKVLPADKLTPEEEAACKRMKIKPEVYLAQRKEMTSQNEGWAPSQHG